MPLHKLQAYEAAKAELAAFDLFAKHCATASTTDRANTLGIAADMQVTRVWSMGAYSSAKGDAGFNRFLKARLIADREALLAEHRAALVANLDLLKKAADEEAVAIIREKAPV